MGRRDGGGGGVRVVEWGDGGGSVGSGGDGVRWRSYGEREGEKEELWGKGG